LTRIGTIQELRRARDYIDSLPHPKKIIIAGNHEVSLDTVFYSSPKNKFHRSLLKKKSFDAWAHSIQCKEIISVSGHLNNVGSYHYLEDSFCSIWPKGPVCDVSGLKVYGSPFTPVHYDMGFTLSRGAELASKWAQIPTDTDVLVTHGPPMGVLDALFDGSHVGCQDLLEVVQERVKPRLHIFGHIHEGYGALFINVIFLCFQALII
jgi:Icc-related predicted phosphoesterase